MQQWVGSESYIMLPSVPVEEYTDIFGNICQRMMAPPGEFSVRTSADVMTTDTMDVNPGDYFVEIQNLPSTVLSFLLPSRYCESDRFGNMAREITAGATLGYDQVNAINNWIQNSIRYNPGSSAFPVSAVEVNRQGQGVCRDLAHLGITLCRSISIPARLVVGYLYGLEPMDLHAWFEAYVGHRWYTFDPTQGVLRGGRVSLAYGRDAAEVAIYHQFGPPAFYTGMDVRVELLEGPPT
jgi:transglutaminase-like putative cysteine protease